jgi:hypothetical protein
VFHAVGQAQRAEQRLHPGPVYRLPAQPRGQPQLVGRGQVLDEILDRILEDVRDREAAQLAPLASACGGHRTTCDLQ